MRIVVGASDVAATRFAVSPAWESVMLLRRTLRTAVGERLRQDAGLRTLAFLHGPRWGATFVAPPPAGMTQTIDDDLAAIAATPAEVVRAEVGTMLRMRRPDAEVGALLSGPDVVTTVVAAVRRAWQLLPPDDWRRVRAVLERDVRFRAARLAESGWSGALAGMHPRLR